MFRFVLLIASIALPRLIWCQALGTALESTPSAGDIRAVIDQMKELRGDIKAVKQSQNGIQKTLIDLRDILTGKTPTADNLFINVEAGPTLGTSSAKIVMIEFTDFQCQFCAAFERQTFEGLVDKYVKTGNLRYVVRNFPLGSVHPLAEKAAEAALCANEQGHYWEARRRFFNNQQALTLEDLREHAVSLNLDLARFQQCIDSGKQSLRVGEDVADGERIGVNATPTFFLGAADPSHPSRIHITKTLKGALRLRQFQVEIDDLLDEKQTGQYESRKK